MRLLIVSAYFDSHRGGIEIVAGRLAEEFRRAGHAVTWLASDAAYAGPANEEGARRVPVTAFNGMEDRLGLPFPIPGRESLRTIRREVAQADVVILHDCVYPTNVAAFLAARWFGKPVVVTQHIGAVPYRSPLLRGLMKLVTRLVTRPMLAAADQVVFISNITAEAFAGIRYRVPPRLIFNGVDTDLFRPATDADERVALRAQFGLPSDRPVALFVGRFVEKKGLHILREAARLGSDVVWVFVGWGPLDPRGWGLPNVSVHSGLAATRLAALYRTSDAFVLPSTGEGFPAVVQEALASGVPVVCGAETARADERLAGLVQPIEIIDRDPGKTASDVVQAVRVAIAQPQRDRCADVAEWYNWSRAGRLHLDVMMSLSAEAAAQGRGAPAASLWQPGMEG
jgi:glycosyltransferase involved in cell wall biosynthesis